MRIILSIAAAMFAFTGATHADIFQWEYTNAADPSQGKQQSTTLAPDGAGVDAVPGANLQNRNLIMAYLIGADLTGVTAYFANLTDADLSGANVTKASFSFATLTGADFTGTQVTGANFGRSGSGGISLAQLYSTASYQAHDLSGINLFYNDLAGANFAGQNLTNANFGGATLTDADFTGAEVRAASFTSTTSRG